MSPSKEAINVAGGIEVESGQGGVRKHPHSVTQGTGRQRDWATARSFSLKGRAAGMLRGDSREDKSSPGGNGTKL